MFRTLRWSRFRRSFLFQEVYLANRTSMRQYFADFVATEGASNEWARLILDVMVAESAR